MHQLETVITQITTLDIIVRLICQLKRPDDVSRIVIQQKPSWKAAIKVKQSTSEQEVGIGERCADKEMRTDFRK